MCNTTSAGKGRGREGGREGLVVYSLLSGASLDDVRVS